MGNLTGLISDVVAGVNTRMAVDFATIQYYYGHEKYIQKIMIDRMRDLDTSDLVYPFIALIEDITETRESEQMYEYEASVTLLIVMKSAKQHSRPKRETEVFEPVLYPIYNALMLELKSIGYFGVDEYNNIPHNKTNRPYYSTDGAAVQNKFASVTDAIEINNLELKILKTC